MARAISSARSKWSLRFRPSGSDEERDFAGGAMDLGLAPAFLGVSTAVIASSIHRQASSNCPKPHEPGQARRIEWN